MRFKATSGQHYISILSFLSYNSALGKCPSLAVVNTSPQTAQQARRQQDEVCLSLGSSVMKRWPNTNFIVGLISSFTIPDLASCRAHILVWIALPP